MRPCGGVAHPARAKALASWGVEFYLTNMGPLYATRRPPGRGVERWYAAGADMPIVTLPPDRSVEELDYILDALAPTVAPGA